MVNLHNCAPWTPAPDCLSAPHLIPANFRLSPSVTIDWDIDWSQSILRSIYISSNSWNWSFSMENIIFRAFFFFVSWGPTLLLAFIASNMSSSRGRVRGNRIFESIRFVVFLIFNNLRHNYFSLFCGMKIGVINSAVTLLSLSEGRFLDLL